jgi:hypothetical protein
MDTKVGIKSFNKWAFILPFFYLSFSSIPCMGQQDYYSIIFTAIKSDLLDTTYYESVLSPFGSSGLDNGDLLDSTVNPTFNFRGYDQKINDSLNLSSCSYLIVDSKNFNSIETEFQIKGNSNGISSSSNFYGTGNLHLFWDTSSIDRTTLDSFEIESVIAIADKGFLGEIGFKVVTLYNRYSPGAKKLVPPLRIFVNPLYACHSNGLGFYFTLVIRYRKVLSLFEFPEPEFRPRVIQVGENRIRIVNPTDRPIRIFVFNSLGKILKDYLMSPREEIICNDLLSKQLYLLNYQSPGSFGNFKFVIR